MKLKDTFVIQEFDDEQILVDTGENGFHGIVRGNKTAAFIVNCLKKETTREEILDTMCAKYDAPRETIAKSVDVVIGKLRALSALDE